MAKAMAMAKTKAKTNSQQPTTNNQNSKPQAQSPKLKAQSPKLKAQNPKPKANPATAIRTKKSYPLMYHVRG